MITKEQALMGKVFIQVYQYTKGRCMITMKGEILYQNGIDIVAMDKPIKWFANGKCQTWKTRPGEFNLPIKHGLYDYGCLTHENAHLFDIG